MFGSVLLNIATTVQSLVKYKSEIPILLNVSQIVRTKSYFLLLAPHVLHTVYKMSGAQVKHLPLLIYQQIYPLKWPSRVCLMFFHYSMNFDSFEGGSWISELDVGGDGSWSVSTGITTIPRSDGMIKTISYIYMIEL